jgi:hypothetical protein
MCARVIGVLFLWGGGRYRRVGREEEGAGG